MGTVCTLMENNVCTVTLVKSLSKEKDCCVRLVELTAAVVELPKFTSRAHIYNTLTRAQPRKESSCSGFDLLLRISLGGE